MGRKQVGLLGLAGPEQPFLWLAGMHDQLRASEPATGSGGSLPKARSQRPSIAESFSGRRNSLNFLRLVLALTVVVSHSRALGGKGDVASEDFLNISAGQIAVFGFFGISGFLIARSAERHHLGRYLWQRFIRIFPAYWVCLILTAFVFGVLAWHHTSTQSISHYFDSPTGPLHYVYRNSLLHQGQSGIAGTPTDVPLPGIWNGSLWTLEYEFACYILLGALAVLGLLSRRAVVLALALVSWGVAAYFAFTQTVISQGTIGFLEARMLGFVPLFLTGALLYLYRDKIPDSGWIAAASAAAFVGSLWLPYGSTLTYTLFPTVTAAVVASVFLVYPTIWLGIHLPFQKIGARNDYSYGVYIYAWPVQELLATWHLQRWGIPVFMLLSVGVTIPFAVASWWIVERNALKLKGIAAPEYSHLAPT